MKWILIITATIALAGCSTPAEQPKASDTQADKAAVDKVRDAFAAAFNAGDAAKIGDLYADNAVMLPADQPTVEGRAAIVEHNKGMFDQFSGKINITPLHTTMSGDIAIDEGTYTMELMPKAGGGAPIMEEGRYLVILQRQGDSWKLIDDIDNRSKPAAAPAAAPAKPESKSAAPATKTKSK